MGAMMEPALRIAVDSLHTYNQKGLNSAEGLYDDQEPFRNPVTYSAQIDKKADHNTEAFVAGLQNALQHGQESGLDDGSEEGFMDLFKAGARLAGKGLSVAAKHGLPILAQVLAPSGAESAEADGAAPSIGGISSEDLAKRAVAGEAALQALMKIDPHRLEEEGFFTSIVSAVKKIAPVVMKVAPSVISNISPTIGGILKAATGQESTFASDQTTRRLVSRKQSHLTLRKKPSHNDFLLKVKTFHDNRVY